MLIAFDAVLGIGRLHGYPAAKETQFAVARMRLTIDLTPLRERCFFAFPHRLSDRTELQLS
jgi:hypothetical protein